MGSVHPTRSHKRQADHQIQIQIHRHRIRGLSSGPASSHVCDKGRAGLGTSKSPVDPSRHLILCKIASIFRTYVLVCDSDVRVPLVGIMYSVCMFDVWHKAILHSRLKSQPASFGVRAISCFWYLPIQCRASSSYNSTIDSKRKGGTSCVSSRDRPSGSRVILRSCCLLPRLPAQRVHHKA